jgi:hypothetical protein
MTRDEIAEINPEALLCDGLDDAIIGVAERINLGPVVAYDVEKIIAILSKNMEVDESELEEGETIEMKQYEMAYEYFEFNIKGAWTVSYTHLRAHETG